MPPGPAPSSPSCRATPRREIETQVAARREDRDGRRAPLPGALRGRHGDPAQDGRDAEPLAPCRAAAPVAPDHEAMNGRSGRRRLRSGTTDDPGAARPHDRRSAHEGDGGSPMIDDTIRRRAGGRAARQAARAHDTTVHPPYLTRTHGALRGPLGGGAGAHRAQRRHDPRGDRHRVPRRRRGAPHCSARRAPTSRASACVSRAACAAQIVQAQRPREFTQHARNPARNVHIGGKSTVFAPAYGPPFIRNLDEGRRYATIEDFRNFVKLAYMSPSLHHSGGTVCEPVDLPVNKRHFDMVYSHMR